ncbi:eukaryotic translation initiation factor 4 gamma 3-like isoform X2 [Brachyhypopomus gauderio]|uniref:eukaryotic translation initiation factor 4 gamma 3-like isoform X2 n=1 Tax=Brachyhypopomus gauderio TaxID=698409 RepID=UPI004042B7DF
MYYPAQPLVMILVPLQQQALPPQQPATPTKWGRKQIRIQDPNQGGRDITEEMISGGHSLCTPTEEKKKYVREFLLGLQFISASMNKPCTVVLDKRRVRG